MEKQEEGKEEGRNNVCICVYIFWSPLLFLYKGTTPVKFYPYKLVDLNYLQKTISSPMFPYAMNT